MAVMDSTTQKWVANLKEAYPHLPDALPIELEVKNLKRLENWFERLSGLREAYDQMDRSDLPEELQNETGRRTIIPVLMSLDSMTPDESHAWHELYVCLSAALADIVYDYWRTHSAGENAMSLEDSLNYTPIVFLYVLSSFNPYPSTKTHDKNFSHSEDGRVRLITWLHIDARRHINTYLQQHAYTIKRGSGYTHRLRQIIHDAQQAYYAREGVYPPEDKLIDVVSTTHYGSLVSRSTLSGHVNEILSSENTVSLDQPITNSSSPGSEITFEETLSGDYTEIESDIYNPIRFVETYTSHNPILYSACQKLIFGDNTLSLIERIHLGT